MIDSRIEGTQNTMLSDPPIIEGGFTMVPLNFCLIKNEISMFFSFLIELTSTLLIRKRLKRILLRTKHTILYAWRGT